MSDTDNVPRRLSARGHGKQVNCFAPPQTDHDAESDTIAGCTIISWDATSGAVLFQPLRGRTAEVNNRLHSVPTANDFSQTA